MCFFQQTINLTFSSFTDYFGIFLTISLLLTISDCFRPGLKKIFDRSTGGRSKLGQSGVRDELYRGRDESRQEAGRESGSRGDRYSVGESQNQRDRESDRETRRQRDSKEIIELRESQNQRVRVSNRRNFGSKPQSKMSVVGVRKKYFSGLLQTIFMLFPFQTISDYNGLFQTIYNYFRLFLTISCFF